MSLLLTDLEIVELTGFKRTKAQADWLMRQGWIFTVNGAGRPIVLRSYAERRLGGMVAAGEAEPNFARIR